MTVSKRIFDLLLGAVIGLLLLPVIVVIGLCILILDGRPVFYISERMKSPTQPFNLLKFRTMKPSSENTGVSGGDKSSRVTRCGPFLRKSRLDELPQVFNVLLGDTSFVGPRPPLRQYVDKFPDTYREVLKSRPGITGLASIYFHKHEEYLLASCKDSAQTDAVYSRRCVPRKAHIDLLYQKNRSICFDMDIMIKTVFRSLR